MPPNIDAMTSTVYICDNLPFLKALPTESVDLVSIDPPFGKNQTFEGEIKSPLTNDELRIEWDLLESWGVNDADSAYEAGLEWPDQSGKTAKFEEIWNFSRHVEAGWIEQLEHLNPGLSMLIQSIRYTHSNGTAAYIAFMAERMFELKRVLKQTGSVYLHCDHDANAYLRQMMDAVFGKENLRNEIIWHRTAENLSRKKLRRASETIFHYSKSRNYQWNIQYHNHDPNYVSATYRRSDENGPYTTTSCTNNAYRPNMIYEFNGNTRQWRYQKSTMEQYQREGLLVFNKKGIPRLKKYLKDSPGTMLTNVWSDIDVLASNAKERTGYPTQKPQSLAMRIIQASSKCGDIVLDCFAGCATVAVAAQLSNRRWIACDMSPRAWTMMRRQFHKHPDLGIVTEGEIAPDPGNSDLLMEPQMLGKIIRVRGPKDLPQPVPQNAQAVMKAVTAPAPIKYKMRPHETHQQIWQAFVDTWGPRCWYCGRETRADRRELHLDHVERNARDGSNDDCWNRALACAPCNSDKADRLSPQETIDKALNEGRIATEHLAKEQADIFAKRMEWAAKRWDEIKPNRLVQ